MDIYKTREMHLSRDKTECCGFGGLMCFADRDLSERVVQRRIETTPDQMIAYCAMCRDRFASQGKATPHLLDLVFTSESQEAEWAGWPDYSQGCENRARLKRSLLSESWKESVGVTQESYQDVILHILFCTNRLPQSSRSGPEDLKKRHLEFLCVSRSGIDLVVTLLAGRLNDMVRFRTRELLGIHDLDEILFRFPEILHYTATVIERSSGHRLRLDMVAWQDSRLPDQGLLEPALGAVSQIRSAQAGGCLDVETVRRTDQLSDSSGMEKRSIIRASSMSPQTDQFEEREGR